MIVTVVAAYLVGGIPTADWIAAIQGVDLRSSGSGNPGANNARRLGGPMLGVMVLVVEVAKGVAVVAAARAVDPAFGAPAAVAAVAGNVVNPYRRFSGGQGLGISLGVLLAAWPVVVPFVIVAIGLVAAVLKRAPAAAITAIAVLLGGAALWRVRQLPVAWGLEPDRLVLLAVGMAVVLLPKQIRNLVADRHPG